MSDSSAHTTMQGAPASDLIGCPVCDAVYKLTPDVSGQATRCRRCGHRISLGKTAAVARLVSLSATNVALLSLVLFLPFLELKAGQFDNQASVIDVVLGFSSGIMVPLALAVLAFILMLPLSRFLLLIYALGPISAGMRNLPQAERALRFAFKLKPWAMAEIFMVGVAVALVKLSDLATIAIGPAFWIFALIVVLNAYQDSFMCRHTLWTALKGNA
ncbi:paraquat-inducible protein A [Gymnodinialimonas sp. 2305UL16-5]|uniref:paraquat-inducible protein A n=1 Tax=Gymnodinialimonas mytili TaxID=3126503 RepID=UPI00309B61E1